MLRYLLNFNNSNQTRPEVARAIDLQPTPCAPPHVQVKLAAIELAEFMSLVGEKLHPSPW